MAKALPDKFELLADQKLKDLTGSDKTKYDAYYAERARRKDITAEGVAQEALDALDEIDARRGSSSEVFTKSGYDLRTVLKPAVSERDRIKRELGEKPSKDVSSDILDVLKIKTDEEIPEFVKQK